MPKKKSSKHSSQPDLLRAGAPTKLRTKMTPLEALRRAQEITGLDPGYARKAETYLKELREDQLKFGERTAT